jgi:nicotinamidase-related amidase
MSHCENPQAFFEYLEEWENHLKVVPLVQAAPDPTRTVIFSSDMVKGFCSIGPLASTRIASIIPHVVSLFENCWDYGIHNIVLVQDEHEKDAIEFGAYPVHCVRGSEEAQAIDEFKNLPFYDQMSIIHKNSISAALNTALKDWIDTHPDIDTFIIVGDCTDICIYQLAMYLRMDANANQQQRSVIVPADCVETFDRPATIAQIEGGFPHPGDLLHNLFLYHMALNSIEIVRRIG